MFMTEPLREVHRRRQSQAQASGSLYVTVCDSPWISKGLSNLWAGNSAAARLILVALKALASQARSTRAPGPLTGMAASMTADDGWPPGGYAVNDQACWPRHQPGR